MTASTADAGQALFTPGELTVHRDPAGLRRVSNALRAAGKRVVALTPSTSSSASGASRLV